MEFVKDLLNECHGFVLFNNKHPIDSEENKRQVQRLNDTLDELKEKTGGSYYTSEQYKAVEESMQEEETRRRDDLTQKLREREAQSKQNIKQIDGEIKRQRPLELRFSKEMEEMMMSERAKEEFERELLVELEDKKRKEIEKMEKYKRENALQQKTVRDTIRKDIVTVKESGRYLLFFKEMGKRFAQSLGLSNSFVKSAAKAGGLFGHVVDGVVGLKLFSQ